MAICDYDLSKWAVQDPKSIRELVEAIDGSGYGTVFVTDSLGRLLASVTDGDIRRALLRGSGLDSPARAALHTGVVSLLEGSEWGPVIARGLKHGLTDYPLVDVSGRLIGVKTLPKADRGSSRENTVVIMAGGKGLRLRPLTEHTPKPLLVVGGKPILQRIVENLRDEGFARIVIAVNYLAEQIEDYFADGRNFGVDIEYVREDDPLGTAGALSLVPNLSSLPLVVMNADVVLAASVAQMLDFHVDRGSTVTVAAKVVESTVPYGVLITDEAVVRRIDEKPVRRDLVNAGVYVVAPDVVESVPPGQFLDMPDLIAQYSPSGRVFAFPIHEAWADLGHPDELRKAQAQMNFRGDPR